MGLGFTKVHTSSARPGQLCKAHLNPKKMCRLGIGEKGEERGDEGNGGETWYLERPLVEDGAMHLRRGVHGVMLSALGFPNYTAFCFLIASMGLQALWSLGLACLDVFAIKMKRDLHNPMLVSLFVVGDWVTATLSLAQRALQQV
uniref:CASP-like protein n=1 Tax=Ananas comosus var. bracteatus TaxID=296719 RepID=A0A6V7QVJ0_ANACO